jgi:hypothetical protein
VAGVVRGPHDHEDDEPDQAQPGQRSDQFESPVRKSTPVSDR